jgi:hypothetical protein
MATALLLAATAVLAGCGDDAPASGTGVDTAARPCATLVDGNEPFPGPDLLAALPLADLDHNSYQASEHRLIRSTGTCQPVEPPTEITECRPASGDEQRLSGLIMWRGEDPFAQQMFAGGATRYISVDFTGHTHGGAAVFRLRLVEVLFADGQTASASSPLAIARGCGARSDEPSSSGGTRLTAYDGDEPYLTVAQDGARVIVVEARIGSFGEISGRYPETRSGLLPPPAMQAALAWFRTWVGRQ